MKKSDIKPGMVIECRNHNKYLIVRETVGANYTSWIDLDNCDLLLFNSYSSNYDIMRVYNIDKNKFKGSLSEVFNEECLILLWERKEEIELTLEDIAKKFGIEVEQIRIKK